MAQKKNSQSNAGLEVGLAIAGLAAIAGGVFLYGTDAGKKKLKQIKGWSLKAKGEVIERLEKLKDVNEETYHKVVDAVAAKYQSVKTIAPEEVADLVADLRKSWKDIVKIAQSAKSPKKKTATAKKPATKSTAATKKTA